MTPAPAEPAYAPRPAAAPEESGPAPAGLVIGEAVELDLPPAPMLARIGSGFIDLLVTGTSVFFGLVIASLVALRADEALMYATMILTLVFAFLVVPTGMETATRGRSIGKYAMGLRTVRDDGGPISFSHALTRALIGYVEIYASFGAPAFLSSLINRRGKRLGDLAAGTYVISDRTSLVMPAPTWVPPPLHRWAGRAEVSALPVETASRIRALIARAPDLHPEARDAAARALRTEVEAAVSPPPPPGTPDLVYLGAVMAIRRDRAAVRLHAQAEQRRRLLQRD